MIDYRRHARQVALPEVGKHGQSAIAEAPTRFEGDASIAAELHARAGGRVVEGEAAVVVRVPATESPCAALGAGAWAAVEAARRALGQPPREPPEGLVDALTPR